MMIGARRFPDMVPVDLSASTVAAAPSLADMAPAQVPAAPPQTHFFGQGGVGRSIAGNIGDFLLQMNHMQPIYAPARAEQTAFERGEQQYQRRRQDNLTDSAAEFQRQLGLVDYKRLHPDDELSRALDAAGITDPAQRQQYYKAQADRLTAPPMMSAPGTDANGNPTMTFYPRPSAINTPAGAPAVGTIRNGYRFKGGNPADQNAWEAVGGQTQPASGNFLDNVTAQAESRGNPNAVSPKGARGLMQVMPSTAHNPGFGIAPSNGTPADDVRVGREYRAAMHTRYGGDLAKMWAAYNAGPGAVDQALHHGPSWLQALPQETQNYVRANLQAVRGM